MKPSCRVTADVTQPTHYTRLENEVSCPALFTVLEERGAETALPCPEVTVTLTKPGNQDLLKPSLQQRLDV